MAEEKTNQTTAPATSSEKTSSNQPAATDATSSAAAITQSPASTSKVSYTISRMSDEDVFLFNEGKHYRLYEKLGSHLMSVDGVQGTYFSVWAPNAQDVHVVGNFNNWDRKSHPLKLRGSSGLWEGFIPGVGKGEIYKYFIRSQFNNYQVEKTDPFGVYHELSPNTASIVWDLEYTWHDDAWMNKRAAKNRIDAPISIYEMHPGSWRRVAEEDDRYLNYREMAPLLTKYLQQLGFTHVEFLPVMEHPFYGSWGYQSTGYFAPTSRYGTPQDFMYLIDYLHEHDIGVILDWVPSHFPTDMHSLGYFDGTHVYEHADPRKGIHPDWQSFIFNHGRYEVSCFLINSALYWLDKYHIDGLRVDAVASMLYLDYSRREGEWIPNQYGGNENLDAIAFIRRFNEEIYLQYPDTQTIAEESTSWGMVSRPTYVGGLGFGMKWDMGWMHDTLAYMQQDPVHRKYRHNQLTFRMVYAFNENFVLPLSHDEVVHGKGSLIGKMPGDTWQKFANLRLLLGMMYAQPSKKLLFMGGEIAQWREWDHERSLDWELVEHATHAGIQQWVRDLNWLYRLEPVLYEMDCDPTGFEWVDCNDWQHSIVSFIRKGKTTRDIILAVFNFTPVPREYYHVGVPYGGTWKEILNSDASIYGGSNLGNGGGVEAVKQSCHGRPFCLKITVPPLGMVFFKHEHVQHKPAGLLAQQSMLGATVQEERVAQRDVAAASSEETKDK
jgi:1,4-alpha-glucan branching enzyme